MCVSSPGSSLQGRNRNPHLKSGPECVPSYSIAAPRSQKFPANQLGQELPPSIFTVVVVDVASGRCSRCF